MFFLMDEAHRRRRTHTLFFWPIRTKKNENKSDGRGSRRWKKKRVQNRGNCDVRGAKKERDKREEGSHLTSNNNNTPLAAFFFEKEKEKAGKK